MNRHFLHLTFFLLAMPGVGYASWQFNEVNNSFQNGSLNISRSWHFNISMNKNGEIYEENNHVGEVIYETENDLVGGEITSNFIYNENNDLSVNGYIASQLGSNIHLFSSTSVYISLPKAIHYEDTNEDYPITGIDHLGTYTTIGGLLHRRYLYITIPSSYTFIGNYAFYMTGSDHSDACVEYFIPSSVKYIGHEAFNFSTLNHMKDMNDQKYKFRVTYEGSAEEFIELIENSKRIYEEKYYGVKKDELEEKCKLFQNEVNDTGGIIYSGSTTYSWFFRPYGQSKSGANSTYWPKQTDYIDVYCGINPNTSKKEIVRYYANSPISEKCLPKISHYVEKEYTYIEPQIIEIDE